MLALVGTLMQFVSYADFWKGGKMLAWTADIQHQQEATKNFQLL